MNKYKLQQILIPVPGKRHSSASKSFQMKSSFLKQIRLFPSLLHTHSLSLSLSHSLFLALTHSFSHSLSLPRTLSLKHNARWILRLLRHISRKHQIFRNFFQSFQLSSFFHSKGPKKIRSRVVFLKLAQNFMQWKEIFCKQTDKIGAILVPDERELKFCET